MKAARLTLLNLGAGACVFIAVFLHNPWWLLGFVWFTAMCCIEESKR
jgi:hypothetical protein